VFAPLVESEHAAAAARLAALLALRGRSSGALTLLQARTAVTAARAAGLPGGAARMADVAFAAGAGLALREAGRRVPSRLERAAIAYGGTLLVLAAQRSVRR
jgi:hypothetical protein